MAHASPKLDPREEHFLIPSGHAGLNVFLRLLPAPSPPADGRATWASRRRVGTGRCRERSWYERAQVAKCRTCDGPSSLLARWG